MDDFFLELLPRNCYAFTSGESSRATWNRRGNGMSSLCPSCCRSTFAREKLRETLAWRAQCWKEDEVDPSIAAGAVKKTLASRSKIIALDRAGAAWSFLEEYFALNASIERVFRYCHGRFKSDTAHIITVELVAGLHPPEFKTKVVSALDVRGSWKEHPDLVY